MNQGPPPPLAEGRVGGGPQHQFQQPQGYSSSLINPANKFNTIHGNKRPLPSINHYESAAEARLGSGKDPALFARGRDNFNSYHMSTLGRSSSMRAKDPLLRSNLPPPRSSEAGPDFGNSNSNSSSDNSSSGVGNGNGGGGGGGKGQQVTDSAYGTTRSTKKVYL